MPRFTSRSLVQEFRSKAFLVLGGYDLIVLRLRCVSRTLSRDRYLIVP